MSQNSQGLQEPAEGVDATFTINRAHKCIIRQERGRLVMVPPSRQFGLWHPVHATEASEQLSGKITPNVA